MKLRKRLEVFRLTFFIEGRFGNGVPFSKFDKSEYITLFLFIFQNRIAIFW